MAKPYGCQMDSMYNHIDPVYAEFVRRVQGSGVFPQLNKPGKKIGGKKSGKK